MNAYNSALKSTNYLIVAFISSLAVMYNGLLTPILAVKEPVENFFDSFFPRLEGISLIVRFAVLSLFSIRLVIITQFIKKGNSRNQKRSGMSKQLLFFNQKGKLAIENAVGA